MSKKRIANYVFLPGVSSDSIAFPNAYSLLKDNKTFITKEATAYIAQQIIADTAQNVYPNATATLVANRTFIIDEISAWTSYQVANNVGIFSGYTYGATEIAKCKRDVGYLIDALIYDIRYGGNERVSYIASQYYLSGVVQVINIGVEVAIQNHLWYIITSFVLAKSAYSSQQSPVASVQVTTGAASEGPAITRTTSLSLIVSNVITGGLSTIPTAVYSVYNFPGYTYDGTKCERDIKYIIDAYLHDLRYGGNVETRLIAGRYWDGEIPQVDGDRKPEIATHTFIRNLINNYIFTGAAYTVLQISYPRQLVGGIISESGATARITTLAGIVTTVIQSGLSAVPEVAYGVTTIKLQGQYHLDKLLLITNATTNQIIYNFSDPLLGATSNFKASNNSNGNDNDTDYPSFLQVTDSITTLHLVADTSTSSHTDDIQIFVESDVQITRPHDFGTDAIERMRVAQPQSMLDADFEYGLQPTKWQAIGIARGYPSVYEIPGTDTTVISVVTDASAGTSGVGESLITVTTAGAHGFTTGTPITIRSLANTISGFSRAEGTFIIIAVPTTTTFNYYATAKVGTSNGQVLATTYTQLRKGAFYTGANIGTPTFSVASNGTTGSFVTKFITSVGSDQLAVAGVMPELGVPISGTGIALGTQISGTVGTGGVAITASIGTPATIGNTVINVVDATGILEGMAVDNGSGVAVFVSNISGTDISITQPLTANKSGNTETYLNKTGVNVIPAGAGATFSVDRTSGVYNNIQITAVGTNYSVNTKLKILGSNLGGVDITNDLLLKVTAVSTIDSHPNISLYTTDSVAGAGAVFDVTINSSNEYLVSVDTAGSSFAAGDNISILGSLVGGTAVTNDLTFDVATVTATYTNVSYSTTNSALGAGATFNVIRTGSTYSVTVSSGGTNFQVGESITILGSLLGGADVTNDLSFVVATETGLIIDTITTITGTASGVGAIVTVNNITGIAVIQTGTLASVAIVSGTSVVGERSYTALAQSSTTGLGSLATFNVITNAGAYGVTIVDTGAGYEFGEQLTILGSALGGTDVANDLTITITSASIGPGSIVTFNFSGTAGTTDTIFTLRTATKIAPGSGSSFDIIRSVGAYTSVVLNLNGTGYDTNDVISIDGLNLGGTTVTHDLTITVASVGISGNITSVSYTGTATLGGTIEFYSAVALSDITVATIPDATTITTSAIAIIQIAFTSPHGLIPGASMLIDINSAGTNHALAKGPFYVESVPTVNTVRYTARAIGAIDTNTALLGTVYARPDSYFIHRPFDGGVQLGTGGPQHGVQAIRMSKKYIRYQSGKGIMYTTGALFAPSYNLQAIDSTGTAVGSFITVTTDDVDHGCQVGGYIRIIGVDTAGYNGDYTIVDVITERQFKIQAQTTLGNVYGSITTAAQMSILEWHGATVRAGTFDDQNGMYWEYNGKELAVGLRSSTLQLSGVSSIIKDTNIVTGTNTRFRDQIAAGDRIVIKGMTHVVSAVTSQTSMSVTPDYRGANNAVQAKVCLVQDLIIKQSDFNLDRLDGTGPSGYNLDISKMQMIGMQWSWYGAGFIDYMLRGADGNYVFAHRIRNSNVNTEAYMRTGNMPVRYEVINEGPPGKLRQSITATQTTIPLVDASSFPNESGIVYIDNELIAFSGRSGNTLIGCTRNAPMVNFVGGAQRTFRAAAAVVHEVNTGVVLVSNTISPIISHWGSAMLTDGRFDEDRGYLFNYASTGIQASTTKQTAFLIRLAPSVSNAIIGDLGDRELINRAQLLLKSIAVTSDTGTGGLVIEGVLNPQNYPIDPSAISWAGLAGSSAGGQPSFAQVAPGGSVSWAGGASVTTSTATTTAALTGTATVPNNVLFQSSAGSSTLYVTKTSWDTLGATPGFSVAASETKYPSGTTVSTVTANPNPNATTLGLIIGTATVPNNAGFNVGAGQTFVYVTQASWQALNAGVGSAVFGTTDFPANTVVTQVNGPSVFSGISYYQIIFNRASSIAHNANSTIPFFITGAGTVGATTLNFTQASWVALPIATAVVTNTTNDTGKFAAGTQIQAISTLRTFAGVNYYTVTFNTSLLVTTAPSVEVTFNFTAYYIIILSKPASVTIAANATVTFTPAVISTNTSFLYFTQASWATLTATYGATTGTEIVDVAKFPSGTKIASVGLLSSFGGTAYYRVNFTQSSIAAIGAASTITFQFGLPPYALPGETVFSFIAAPGSAQTLDLGELKELTNTTLGGRGTYPNGPDVLAINVYRASGTGSIPTNIVIRWGEAQA